MSFGFVRHELRESATEAKRIFAKGGPHPIAAGGRDVTFVECEIDDLEHGRQTRCDLFTSRHFERSARIRQLFSDEARRVDRREVMPAEGLDVLGYGSQHHIEQWRMEQRDLFYAAK